MWVLNPQGCINRKVLPKPIITIIRIITAISLSTYFGAGTTLNSLTILIHLILQQLFEVSGIIIISLHKRKQRHRVVWFLPNVTQEGNDGDWVDVPGLTSQPVHVPLGLALVGDPSVPRPQEVTMTHWKCTRKGHRQIRREQLMQWALVKLCPRMFHPKKVNCIHVPIFVRLSWKKESGII